MNTAAGYHLAGWASAFFVTLSLTGLALQAKLIYARKRLARDGQLGDERPTSTISLNRFVAAYLGFYSLLVYGLCFVEFNHYLVWPRIVAALIILTVLHALMSERQTVASRCAFFGCAVLLCAAFLIRLLDAPALMLGARIAQGLVVVSMALFVQGATHQIIKIRRAGRTGGLSLPMHQLFFLKDFFSVLFGITMGLAVGWPLLLFNGASMFMQCAVMWNFRWVRVSEIAAQRRTIAPPD